MNESIECLLVDDNTSDSQLFDICIHRVGFAVELTKTTTGLEALEKINAADLYTPDFIFLDINLPIMSGKECLIELKKIDRLAKTEIIMCSNSANPRDVEECMNSGAHHFFTKPFDLDAFTYFVKKIFIHLNLPFHIKENAT